METIRGHFESLSNNLGTPIDFEGLLCTGVEEFLYIDPIDDSVTSAQVCVCVGGCGCGCGWGCVCVHGRAGCGCECVGT